MPITANLHKRYFPSYTKIHKKILQQHQKLHEQKLQQLQCQISQLKQAFNLQEQHQKIKNKLLQNYHSTNHEYMKNILDSLNNEEQKLEKQQSSANKPSYSSTSAYNNNTYSLNYCIDDDMEEDNHYQNHLKFKKQVLERDLYENQFWNGKKDKKKEHYEDFIFKNLYNQRPNTAAGINGSNYAKARRHLKKNYVVSDNVKEFKENIKHLKKSQSFNIKNKTQSGLQKYPGMLNCKKPNSAVHRRNSSTKCLRKQNSGDEFYEQYKICQNNTKILKDSYGKYLKQLQGTNIIKWRVLYGEKQKQKDLMAANISGLVIRNVSAFKQ